MTLVNKISVRLYPAVSTGNFEKILEVLLAPWSSIQFGKTAELARLFGGDYNTPEIEAGLTQLRKDFDVARSYVSDQEDPDFGGFKKGPNGHYTLGWHDGQPYLELTAVCGRQIRVWSHSYNGLMVDIEVDFGRRGSASSARAVLEKLELIGEVFGSSFWVETTDGGNLIDIKAALEVIRGVPDAQWRNE